MPIRPPGPTPRPALAPRGPRLVPLPHALGRDIFERLLPPQSSHAGVPLLNAAGISVPRGGFWDREISDIKDGVIAACVFAVPAVLLGVSMFAFILFHAAFIGMYLHFKHKN